VEKRWLFHDVTGYKYHIGMYHNSTSGNFMLYINQSISIIDFKVFGKKSYSLYIGNEIFKLDISQNDEKEYIYKLNSIAPRLKQAPWEKIRDQVVLYLIIFMLFFVIFSAYFFLFD